jgi:hypothetical protein
MFKVIEEKVEIARSICCRDIKEHGLTAKI